MMKGTARATGFACALGLVMTAGCEPAAGDDPFETAEDRAGLQGPCVHTEAHWRNNHKYAAAPHNIPWPNNFEDTVLCGRSIVSIMSGAPDGTTWHALARVWISAKLNHFGGAYTSPSVNSAFAQAFQLVISCQNPDAQVAAGLQDVLTAWSNGQGPAPACQEGGCSSDADCDDGLFCNGEESCTGGACQAGAPMICDDGNICTTDSCDEATAQCATTDSGICGCTPLGRAYSFYPTPTPEEACAYAELVADFNCLGAADRDCCTIEPCQCTQLGDDLWDCYVEHSVLLHTFCDTDEDCVDAPDCDFLGQTCQCFVGVCY